MRYTPTRPRSSQPCNENSRAAIAAIAAIADCDGSGALDLFDFLCFQNAFAASCP